MINLTEIRMKSLFKPNEGKKQRKIMEHCKKQRNILEHPEIEFACKYYKPIYKTQYSEVLVEYENGFDINTGNLIVHPMATTRSFTDENSNVLAKISKDYRANRWKIKTTRYRKFTITRTITHEQLTFWRNSL